VASDKQMVVVGYGMGAWHSRLIDETEGLHLRGVCDILPAKRERALAEHPGIQTYDHIDKVLADAKVDVVVVVTPHNLHAPMAIASMNAGKHTITDKAMCLTVREAEAMIAARDRNGVILSTFHNRRWDPEFLTVRHILEDGALGRLYHIESCVTSWGEIGGWRRNREEMGGWLFDWGAHLLDQILALAQSRATTVYALEHYRYGSPNTVEDYVECTVTFESGLTARAVVGYLNKLPMPRWYILGEHGSLQVDDFDRPVRMRLPVAGRDSDVTVPLLPGNWQSFYQNISDHFHRGADLAVTPEQIVPQIAIAEAAYRSIAKRQAIRLQ
jgi:scyllo-inositol 2-dehydrogenase (NADP+)